MVVKLGLETCRTSNMLWFSVTYGGKAQLKHTIIH